MKIRVLLVDDQLLFVENLKLVLEANASDVVVAGIARDGLEAVRMAKELLPDVILMDVRMPKLDGVGAASRILEILPRVAIIMLTVFDEDDYVLEALEQGATGYLLKNTKPETLISSVRAAHEGAVLISPSVAQKLVASGGGARHGNAHSPAPWVKELSSRERAVLLLLAEHRSNSEMARELGISAATIRNYVSALYDKMGADDRFHALRMASENRVFLLDPEQISSHLS
ncbi:two component transcriptional regulator, LuxR family [Alkalispirochaeta americana]|uniref:Two component transcriptional regulator, LuxR family n=1 Tax=Alkalispirochaeta americana TaxID=159291 RepID=A0A1N6NIS2_9SPIO|nr:response regulator transcription factor [Alkalispirochaeta americana]SIP92005.1 two component transcriptional regulator, LuxR family [Alkalispirochaeta americana]